MRKKDLAKKWRKVFSAILAATMITTSVVPESLVLAADVEETQGFGDGESLGFESGQDEVSDGNSEENQNVPETQDEDSDDTENGEDGFTDGVEAFSSENGTTVEAGFQSQAIVEEIQERINVLPTVDEFKAMADGTTVEDSTLNQKQTDVYNEAQAIADELEQLSEEEQGQVDTSKLEALFEYFNSMMERADVEISDGDAITSSGTYYLSGNYSSNTGIKATGKVNIYLKDNVKFTRTDNEAFLKSGSSSNDIAIDGNGFTMESNSANEYTNFVQLKSGGKVSVSNIIMHVKGDSLPIANQYGGTFIWNSGTLKTDGAGMLINNSNGGSTLEINGGYLYNGSKGSYSCISGGNVNITGGEIEAPNTTAISGATTATINGGTIKNSKYGIVMSSASKSLTVSNNAKFENNTADIWLSKGKMFTVDSSFKNTASVALSTSNYPTDNSHVQITTDGTDARMLTHFTCANKDYSIGYENGHLYIYKHTHAWNDYLVTDNVITAKCSVSSNPCTYHTNGLKLILSADSDIYYSGSAYEAVVEKNEITSVTGENPSSIKYYLHQTNTQTTLENSGAATTGGAPVYAGKYTAKVSIGGVTANADFTIEKANSSATVDYIPNLAYNGSPLTLVTGTANGGTLWYRLGESGTWQTTPPTATNAGKYKVYYYVEGDKNHKNSGSETSPVNYCEVTIAPKAITATATGFDGTYTENVSHSINVTVTDPTTDYTITYSTTGEPGSYTAENPTFSEVGNYTVYYRVEAGANYSPVNDNAEIKIAGASFDQNDVTATGYTGTYDGTAHSVSVTTTGKAEGAVVTYSTTGAADSYTEKAPQLVNATDGAQTVHYRVHKKGYVDVDGTVTVSIGKKSLDAVISPIEKVYDGTNIATVNATVETGIQNEKLSISGLTGTFKDSNVADEIGVDVDTTHMSIIGENGTDANNYIVSCPTSASGKITPKPITAEITPHGGTYGKVTPAEVSLYGVLEADEAAVKAVLKYTGTANDDTVIADSTTVPEKAGSYTVEAVLENTAICKNYTLPETTENFVIEKAEVSAPSIQEKVYSGANQTADVEISENSLYTVEKNEGGVNVGRYDVVLKLKDTNNYKWKGQKQESAELTVTFVIAQNTNSWTTEPAIAGWTYGESAKEPRAIAAFGKDTLIVEYRSENDEDTNYSQTVPTNAGNYKVRFTVPGTKNYTGLTTVEDLTIAKRPVTVEVDNKKITYGQAEPTYTYTVKNGTVIPGDALNLTYGRKEGKNAGNYIITAAAEAAENPNYEITFTNEAKGTLTIEPKQISIAWGTTDFIYNGTKQKPTAAAVPETLVPGDSCQITVSGAKKDVGTYTAEAGISNPNYRLPENKTIEFKITKKEIGIKWSNLQFIYDGNEKIPTAEATGLETGDTCTISVSGAAVSAGEHTAKADTVSNKNYKLPADTEKKFVIEQAESAFQAPAAVSGLIYNGENQNLITAGSTADGTMKYRIGNSGEWSENLPAGLNAGNYTVFYKVFGDINHKDSQPGTLPVSIAKKTVVVSGITAEGKTYDGNTSAVLKYTDVEFEGKLKKDSLSITAAGVFEDKNAGKKKVLVSDLALGGESAGNYELAKEGQQTETTANISAKEISAAITPNGGIYGGTITGASAVLRGAVAGENPEVVLTYTGKANDGTVVSGTRIPALAGTYKVTVSITDSNYTLKEEGSFSDFTVAKAAPQLSVSAISDKNYGDQEFKLETSNKGNGQKSYASSDEKVATVDENGLVTIVGAGKATLTVFLAETANYTKDQAEVTVTVKKIGRSLVVENMAYTVTYGDPAFKIAAVAGDKEAAIKFTSNNEDVASVSTDGTVTAGNAGTAKITVSMDESQNYLAVSKEVTVTVVPKAVTVTPDNASKTYGDKDGELTYKAAGLVGKDTLAGITVTRAEGEDVGTYDIFASEKENANPNYSVSFNKGTFTIGQREIGLTWTDTELTYNGENQQPKAAATGLVGKDTCEVTVTGAMKNVGTYMVTATALSNKNYKLPEVVSKKYTIGAKEIGIEWSNLEFTYDGTVKKPTATATGLAKGDSCVITVRVDATEAGTHTAKAEAVDNANYKLPGSVEKEYVINKAETAFQKPEVSSELTYNGTAQNLVTAKEVTGGTLMYKVNGGEWSSQIPTGENAGTYIISYKVAGDKNHEDSKEETLTVNIAKKTVVVSGITAEDKIYDGNTSAVVKYNDVKFEGMLEKDSLSITAAGVFEDKNAGKKKVLVSDLALGGESAGNYELAKEGQQTETTANISAKEITAEITPNGGTYEGTITPASAVLNGVVGGEKPEITLTYTGKANDGTEVNNTRVPALAGTYKVTASITDRNYVLKEEGSSADFTVSKAAPQLNVSEIADKIYGDEAFKLEADSKGDGQLTFTSDNKAVVTVDESGLVTIVGAGKATLTVSLAETANYTADIKETTVTVVPKAVTVTPDNASKIYGDKDGEFSYHADGLVGDDTLSDITLTRAEGENAGTYEITASQKNKANPNYSVTFSKGVFTINPKEISINWSNLEFTYDGSKKVPTATAAGLAEGDSCGITVTVTETSAGKHTAKAEAVDNPNYKLPENVETEYVINKAETVFQKPEVKSELTYNGKAQELVTAKDVTGGTLMYKVNDGEWSKQIPTGTNAGSYTISYKVVGDKNHTDSKEETLTVNLVQKEVTVTADDAKKVSGQADPELTYTAEGLAEKDTLSGITVKRKAGEKVGTYAITVSQEKDSNQNYKITFKKGIFTIQQADQSKLKGNAVSKLKLPILLARGKGGNKSITLSWLKYTGADGYEAYWCYCDGSKNYKKFATVKNGKLSVTHKKLKSSREYKYFVAAYKMVEGRKIYIAKSNTLHVAMKEANTTNATSIKVNKSKVTLAVGKTFKLKCTTKVENSKKKQLSHVSGYRYYTNNSKVATVTNAGEIKAKGKGTCTVYILANNGVYKKIKVTVK